MTNFSTDFIMKNPTANTRKSASEILIPKIYYLWHIHDSENVFFIQNEQFSCKMALDANRKDNEWQKMYRE